MKHTLTLTLLLFALTAFGQDISYSIEWVRPDSFFLVEQAQQSFAGSPRPQQVLTAVPFRDTAQLSLFVAKLDAEAADVAAQLAKLQDRNAFLMRRSAALNALKTGGAWRVPAVPVTTAPVQKTPPEKATTKPKTKKKS